MERRKRKRWIAYSVAAFLLVFYHAAFFPYVLEATLKGAVARFTDAALDLRVRRAGLIFGFVFEQIRLTDRIEGKPIFTADRVAIRLALHSLLIGHIGIRELALHNAQVTLDERNGRWNYHALTGKPAEPSVKPPPKPDEPLPPSLSVYLPIKLYANLILDRVSLRMSSGTGAKRTNLEVDNLNFRLALITRTFREIPLNADIMGLFDTLVIGLNPQTPLRVRFDGQPGIEGDVRLTYLLYREEAAAGPEFLTKLHIDTSKLKIGPRGRVFLPVGFAVDYDTLYQSRQDRLMIRELTLRHHDAVWLSLAARIDKAITPERELSLQVTSSQIRLGPLYNLLAVASGGRVPFFTGTVAFAPLNIEGTLQNLKVSGTIRGAGIVYRTSGQPESRIDSLYARFTSGVDLYRAMPFLRRPLDYDAKGALAFGVFHALDIPHLAASYNGAALTGNVGIRPAGVRANVQVARFKIDDWGYGHAWGFLDGSCSYSSNIRFTSMRFGCRLLASDLRYAVGRSRSANNLIQADLDGSMTIGGGTRINLTRLELKGRDEDENPTFALRGAIDMAFGAGQFYDIRLDELALFYDRLRGTLPGSVAHSLQSSEFYLRGAPVINTRTVVRVAQGRTDVQSKAKLELGIADRADLTWDVDASFGPKRMDLRRVQVSGIRGGLRLDTKGTLVKLATGDWDPDLKLALQLKLPKAQELYQDLLLSGNVHVDTDVQSGRALGKIVLDELGVEQRLGNCRQLESPACVRFRLEGVNLKLPFDHHLRIKNPPRLTAGSQYYLTPAGSVQKPNFTVRFVASSHNPRGEFVPGAHFYVGALGAGIDNGLRAHFAYRNNVLTVDGLEIYSYRLDTAGGKIRWKPQGIIYGERIFFNAADLSPQRMEYGAFVQIKDLDLEPFLPKSRTGYDGIISADLQVIGFRLADPLLNTNLRLSVYRLSPEFSGFVTRLVMPGPIAEGIVNRTLEIPSIKVELSGGLVYSTIGIKREALGLGLLIRPGSEEIKQERIPLAQFLANARTEARK